jgi:hypothetical protein
MPKPKRRQPAFGVLDASPQGQMFMGLIQGIVGDDMGCAALELTKDKSHVFHLRGSEGSGELVENAEREEGETYVHRWGFRHAVPNAPAIVQMDCVVYRWDPWLSAKMTGDRSVADLPSTRRREVQETKDAEIGSQKDRVQVLFLPKADAPTDVAGVPVQVIDEIMLKYELTEE